MIFLVKGVVYLIGSLLSFGTFFYYAFNTNLEPSFPVGIIIQWFSHVSRLNVYLYYTIMLCFSVRVDSIEFKLSAYWV